MSAPIYSLRAAQVYQALETSPEGLSADEVETRRSLYGGNLLSEQPRVSDWKGFLKHTFHPMALLLGSAGILSLLAGDLHLGFFIWGVVLVNAGFSFWQEYRAEQALIALRRMLPSYARVIREGLEASIPASEVIPGDVLVLTEGDNIAADARVVEEYGLRTNHANLTGEAIPARRTADASVMEGISELERPNLIFAGTSVVSGTGKAVVYAIGMTTQFGRIVHLTQTVQEAPSPVHQEIDKFTRVVFWIAAGIGLGLFLVALLGISLGARESFLLAMGILAALVPEGLPATITLTLAIAVQRLSQKGVLVKRLSVIETLGNLSVLCTDKSGTLTQNQMTVREIWVAGQHLHVSGVGYEPSGEFSSPGGTIKQSTDLQALLTVATACNNSRLNPPTLQKPHWSSLGDATEAALRVVAMKGGVRQEGVNLLYPRIHEIPFDARRKRMSTIHQVVTPDRALDFESREKEVGNGLIAPFIPEVAFVKGAPRETLQLCSHYLRDGRAEPLDETTRSEILSIHDDCARRALRVLALAYRKLSPRSGIYSAELVERGLTFLGLLAMMDPPRPEVAEAIRVLRQAGIRLVMITGDYGLTAESLARRIGMIQTPAPLIFTGAELDAIDDQELSALIDQEVIYSRMAPEHKLRLVGAMQNRGEVVAVTGDGVNDAPALRKADVGIAMGISGTDVVREAADVVLANDNFGAIVRLVEEGRAFYGNIRKFLTYIFASNVPELIPFLIGGLASMPLALNVRHILAIDLGTDLLPALALGAEKPEPGIMQDLPRRRNQPLVDRKLFTRAFLWLGLIETVLCYAGYFLIIAYATGFEPFPISLSRWWNFMQGIGTASWKVLALATTVFHAGVVMAQVGNVFACRSEQHRGRHLGWLSNSMLIRAVLIEILLILAFIYVPPLYNIFGDSPLPAKAWIMLGFYPVVLYSLEWIRKLILGRSVHLRKGSPMDEGG